MHTLSTIAIYSNQCTLLIVEHTYVNESTMLLHTIENLVKIERSFTNHGKPDQLNAYTMEAKKTTKKQQH